jgi:hypothetical protein
VSSENEIKSVLTIEELKEKYVTQNQVGLISKNDKRKYILNLR